LFGALCWAVRTLFGEAELTALLAQAAAREAFAVSSAFPCLYHAQGVTRFYPRPLLSEPDSTQRRALLDAKQPTVQAELAINESLKRVRKADFVSESIFTDIVNGTSDFVELIRRFSARARRIERRGNCLLTSDERKLLTDEVEDKAFWRRTDVQRNGIDRVFGATVQGVLFFSHELAFQRDCAGLWFVLRADETLLETRLKPALRYLADTGFGGDRSVGKGQFAIELDAQPFALPAADEPNGVVLLSRYLPDNGVGTTAPLAYRLAMLRPRHESQHSGSGHRIFQGILRVLEPGSILPLPAAAPAIIGRLVTMEANAEAHGFTPRHNGLAIPVYARIGGNPHENR
jgi:CRISPR type III-A-associated RAMP protein Csm4